MRDVPADITRIADRVRAAAVVSQGVMKQLAVGVIDAPNRPANRPATPAVGRSARVQGDNESVDQLVARIEATGAPLGSIVEHVGVHVKSKPIASRRAYTQSAERPPWASRS